MLQPEQATQLRDRRPDHTLQQQPGTIVGANIGCIQHLQSGTTNPVRHGVEVFAAVLEG